MGNGREYLLMLLFFAIALTYCETAKGHDDIQFKEVSIHDGLRALLYAPKSANPGQKLPLVVYFHGGCFIYGTAYDNQTDNYVDSIVKKANVVALSVDYTRGVPAAYDDAWAAVKWAASHSSGHGQEPWLNSLVDFKNFFLCGESAGANIAHNIAMRVGLGSGEKVEGLKIKGIALLHPYFWGSKPIGDHEPRAAITRALWGNCWRFANKENSSSDQLDDPRLNPLVDPNLSRLGCNKVLVVIGDKDDFEDRGFYYYQALRKNGWKGKVELMMSQGGHCFFLADKTAKALAVLERLSSFLNEA